MRHWLTIAALLVAAVAQGQFSTTLKTVLSGDNPILFEYHAGDSLSAATFTRTSTAMYRDVAGVLQTASSGVARDNHYALDPVSGLYKRSLLLEGQRTNLALRSEEFDHATWEKEGGVTITANSSVAPDGTTTADRMQYAGGVNSLYQRITFTAAAHTFSIYAKATSGSSAPFRLRLHDGTTATFSADLVATDAWQRFSVTATTLAADGFFSVHSNSAAAAVDIQIFGSQCEVGSFPSSYIPTVASTVSRAADSLSFPFTAVPQEMTMFARLYRVDVDRNNMGLVWLGPNANMIGLLSSSVAGRPIDFFSWSVAEGLQVTGITAVIPIGEARQEYLGYYPHNQGVGVTVRASVNAAAEQSATSATSAMPTTFGGALFFERSAVDNSFMAIGDVIIAKGNRSMDWFRSRIAP